MGETLSLQLVEGGTGQCHEGRLSGAMGLGFDWELGRDGLSQVPWSSGPWGPPSAKPLSHWNQELGIPAGQAVSVQQLLRARHQVGSQGSLREKLEPGSCPFKASATCYRISDQ